MLSTLDQDRFPQGRRELTSRESNGLEVSLQWYRRSGRLKVCVDDAQTGVHFELDADAGNALDVFHHPFSYAAFRGLRIAA